MARESVEKRNGPRPRVHWSLRLLGWALVFAAGMAAGRALASSAEGLERDGPEAGSGEAGVKIEVPCLDQRGRFPTGCESVTAVMALNYAGVDIGVDRFVDELLPKGSAPHMEEDCLLSADPYQCFMGDPRSEDGWGCYAPVIEGAAGLALSETGSGQKVEDLCGTALEELMEGYVSKGTPVILWATQGMEAPSYGPTLTIEGTGERFDWIRPEHCLLLVGERGDTYLFNDPLEGETVAYSKKAVQLAYEALGSQALAIR